MKKVLFIIMIALSMILTGCGFFEKMSCEHEYEIKSVDEYKCGEQGKRTLVCKKCGLEKYEYLPVMEHDYEIVEDVKVTCTADGHIKKVCKNCGDILLEIIESKGHEWGNWVTTKDPTMTEAGERIQECSVCHEKHTEIIALVNYIDFDVIDFDLVSQTSYEVNNKNEAALLFNAAILHEMEVIRMEVKFEFSDFDTLWDEITNEREAPFDYQVSATLSGNILTLTFTYPEKATKKASNVDRYVQYDSLNYNIESNRTSDFDDFAIDRYTKTFKVKNSEQLVYCLERKIKPVFDENSDVEKLYEDIKAILREIVDDDMSDVEKLKAIHDWVVMNVTYDKDLLEKMGYEDNLKSYRGFYLEGAIEDHRAVCEGMSKAVCVMANIEGIPCVIVSGKSATNPGGPGHAWNKVNVNGDWYILDATSDGAIINSEYEILSYEFFLIDEVKYSKKYIGDTFKDLKCTKNYDIFKEAKYTYNFNEYSFEIKNQNDLNNIVKYFYATEGDKMTIQMEIAFDYGTSIDDEINKAFQGVSVSTYSKIQTDNLLMLVK